MNELNLEILTASSAIIDKEPRIKKYLACLSGISKPETINEKFKVIKSLIYTHAFYNSPNSALDINFLYKMDPTIEGPWYEYVLEDDFSGIIKCFFDYLEKENYSTINSLLDDPDDEKSFIDKYFDDSVLANPIFDWKIPENLMPFFCAFFFSIHKYYTKKTSHFTIEDFFNTMWKFIEENPALKYINNDHSELLVELKKIAGHKDSYEIPICTINISKEIFIDIYDKWLRMVFPPYAFINIES